MSAETILKSEIFQKCLDFHGHLCPGLSIGYQAAMAGMEWLSAHRAEDEELVAIVETDACCSDAVQVVTGCTFGKGNFIYHDYGKMAFTFFNRESGKGVRVSRKVTAPPAVNDRYTQLMDKIRGETATEQEYQEFKKLHEIKSMEVLNQAPDQLFEIYGVDISMPAKAVLAPSVQCDRCKEPTMATKLVSVNGQSLCGGCRSQPTH